MATYLELRNLMNDGELRNKVVMATVIYAEGLTTGAPTVDENSWAVQVFNSPRAEGEKMLMGVLAANKDAAVEDIQGATDEQIQINVDALGPSAINAFAGG